MASRFDPVAALQESPPTPRRRGSVFDHPRIQEWLRVWLAQKPVPPHRWMAEQINRGAKIEALGLERLATGTNLQRYLMERGGRELVREVGGAVRPARRARE